MSDILALDATEQLSALAKGQISARELLQAAVDRADSTAKSLNAVVARDLDRAIADALSVDERRARGEQLGRLAGLPMTVKDIFDIDGRPASAGFRPETDPTVRDAAVVARARCADAVVWGMTNTPAGSSDYQTYNRVYGTTNNPWDVSRTPGGSSGGSAAAVAAGVTALEIGADIGGSLRVPASFCGVLAHKPTYGAVSQRGLWKVESDAGWDLLVVGPMARSARDLELLLSIIEDSRAAEDAAPLTLKKLKVGLWLDEPAFALDPEVKAAIETFAQKFSGAGALVEPLASPIDARQLMFAYTMLLYPLIKAEAGLAERVLYEALRGPAKIALALGASPLSPAQAILAASARHREWLSADGARRRMRQAAEQIIGRYDVVLAPVAPVTAFKHDHRPLPQRRLMLSDGRKVEYTQPLNWNALATVCGLPATAIPVSTSPSGLPVGAQLISVGGSDHRLLRIAQAIEAEIGGFVAPPSFS